MLAVFAEHNFIRKSIVCQPILHINLIDSLDKCTRSNFSITYFNDLPVCSFTATWGEILTQCLRSSLPALSDSPQNTLFEMHVTKNLVHQEGKQVWGADSYKRRLETVAWAGWEMLAWNLWSLSWALLESLREMFSSFLFEKQSRNKKGGFCENADINFLIDFPWQGWISAHYYRKQNVISALLTPQK